MQHQIISAGQHSVGTWAGGATRQMYIWPPPASYAARDFAFRVSSATVRLPQSVFTRLPGITRWIMPLSGRMDLQHQGHGGASLAPLQAHCFDGGWHTASAGVCTDFNLMLARGWQGRVSADFGEYQCAPGGFVGVFAFGGPLEVRLVPRQGEPVPARLACLDLLVARGPGLLVLPPGQARGAVFAAFPAMGGG